MEDKTDFLQQAKDIVNKDKRTVFIETTKASTNGAVTGLVVGLMLGYWKGKNVYITGLVGAIIGGVTASIIVNKK